MTNQSEPLLKLKKDQIKPASLMLARAFRDDPIMAYAFPDRDGEDPRLPYAYESMLHLGLKYDLTHTTSTRLEGVAVWRRIRKPSYSFWRILLSGAFLPSMKMGRKTGQRMQTFSQHLDKKHEEMISGIHWYLQLIGVDLEYQGQGFASRLLRGMLIRIDQEGLPCYLETELEANVPLYENFGFRTLEEYPVPSTPLKMWLMLREAAEG